jgi:hypothetical protein
MESVLEFDTNTKRLGKCRTFVFQETHLGASAPEALQDCFHQGSYAPDAHGSGHPRPTAGRTEDSHLRLGEETRGATGHHNPDSGADATFQTGSLLHQIQDSSMEF